MSEHVTEWLGAYHDGELHGLRLHQVEQHLTECAACQAELDELQELSALLRETPPITDFLPAERFSTNLALSLPRQPERTRPRRALEIGWWLIPVGVLGAWLFIQVTFALSSVITFAADARMLGTTLSWLQGKPLQMEWFATAMNLFGNQMGSVGQFTLSELNDVNLFIAEVAGSLIPQILLAVLYLGWLASLWFLYLHQSDPIQKTFPNSNV